MAEIRLVRELPFPPELVWRAMTDPDLVPRWTARGQSARPEGFRPEMGCRFRFVAKPIPGWDGIVHCQVLEVRPPNLLRYSWAGTGDRTATTVAYRIEPSGMGTQLTYEHTGFIGVHGWVMSTLLGRVRRKMLDDGLPQVLEQLADEKLDTRT